MAEMDPRALDLGKILKDVPDEERKERILGRIAARRQVSRPVFRPLRLAVAFSTAALAICGVVLGSIWLGSDDGEAQRSSQPLLLRSGAALDRLAVPEAASLSVTYELSDGSSIALAPGSSLSTTENDGRRASMVIIRGQATFDITPGQRQWTIDAGLASVEVLGTCFTIHRTSQEVTVTVERGTVRLRSDHLEGAERLLRQGETERIAIQTTPDQPERDDEQVIAAEQETPSREPSPDAAPISTTSMPWDALARRGHFDEAYGRLGARGLAERTERARSLEELLLLADVARLSGHPQEAVAPLEEAIARYGGHRRAAVAAFTLGRLQADVLSNPRGAVDAFERCLALGPPAALHADALARIAEVRERVGDHDGASAAAREYLQRYPEGQRARFLGTLLDH